MSPSIVIVDDHPVIMHGLKSFLQKDGEMRVVGEAINSGAALEVIASLLPEVVILDISLEGMDGISLISYIKESSPSTKIVMYTTHENKKYIIRALRGGANGYVLKSEKMAEVVQAINKVLRNELFISSSLPASIIGEIVSGKVEKSAVEGLTAREYEVAALIAQGLRPDKVAETLFISPKTVRVHRTKIMHKLSCTNVHDLLLELREHFPQ